MQLERTGAPGSRETLPLYRLDAEDCWERTPYGVRTLRRCASGRTDSGRSPPGPVGGGRRLLLRTVDQKFSGGGSLGRALARTPVSLRGTKWGRP